MDQSDKAKSPIDATSSGIPTMPQPPHQSQTQTKKGARWPHGDLDNGNQETENHHTISVRDRLEVQWVLEAEPQEEAEEKQEEEGNQPENETNKEEKLSEQLTDQTTATQCSWWPCEVMSSEGQHVLVDAETQDSETFPVFKLKYDPNESVGWQEAEETKCIFVGANRMMDLTYSDSSDCNAFLFYRRQGENFEPPPDEHNNTESDVNVDTTTTTTATTTTTTATTTTTVPQVHTDEPMQVLGQDSHAAAEEIANRLLRPLMQNVQQRGLNMIVQHRVAARLSDLREKSIALIEKRFQSGDDLTLAVANEIIEELKTQLEAGNNKRPRLV